MGHCAHGVFGLCLKAGIGCCRSGVAVVQKNMAKVDAHGVENGLAGGDHAVGFLPYEYTS